MVKLTKQYFKKLIGVNGKTKKSSFIELDDIDSEDDAIIQSSKLISKRKNLLNNNIYKRNIENYNGISFSEMNMKQLNNDFKQARKPRKPKRSKVREIEKLMYNKDDKKKNNKERYKLFRINQMNRLQDRHQWKSSRQERMVGKYSRKIASQGNRNADPFVAYLGFLRDSAFKGNKSILEKEAENFYK